MKRIYIAIMKKYLLCFSLFSLAVLSSCDKDVVDLSPVDRITDQTAFSTSARCELSVIGVYDAAQSGDYNATGAYRGYPFGAASIEQSEMRGEDMVNNASFYSYTYTSSYSTVTGNNKAMWENSFSAINRANVVIEGIQSAGKSNVISSQQALAYEAECRFIRALTYHNLLIHFARPYAHTSDASHYGLPIYQTAINTPERVEEAKSIGRSTVAECYKFILDDLAFAENNLPELNSTNAITRASKGAAIALKTRVYLHMNDWANVIKEANKIVSTSAPFSSSIGGYKLTESPDGPFVNYKSNTESIFSIENSVDDNCSVNGSLSQMLNPDGRGLVSLSPILYNAKFWKSTDKRRSLLLKKGSDAVWYVYKYQHTTMDDYAPIIRYAEVLLNYAEADARLNGKTSLALSLLNAVRNRSVDASDVYSLSDFTTSKDLVQAILNERRIEFMGEGRRWEDIHRLSKDVDFTSNGIPAKATYSNIISFIKKGVNVFDAESGLVDPAIVKVDAIPYSDKRFVWPIPLSELTTNAKLAAQQNEGW